MSGINRHGHGPSYSKGRKATPTYRSWDAMKQRCLNPNSSGYKNYGAKGVTVCERWLSFDNFLEDMGERPDGMTLDRVDGADGYSPDNCRWASHVQQSVNREYCKIKPADKEVIRALRGKVTQCELAARYGVSQQHISFIMSGI